jgi:SAM-dependent methyltransferase
MDRLLLRARLQLAPVLYSSPGGQHLVSAARYATLGALDVRDAMLGRKLELTPPRRLQFVGGGGFHAVGREFLQHFRQLGGLDPHDQVLDVGCGIGRMAVPLTGYLEPPGAYEGFDVVRTGVRWCQEHITPRFPHFRFQVADVYNKRYNRHGRAKSAGYRFPYEPDRFDFAFATSVFTHMLPIETERYISELARVVRPAGRCLATFFLTDTPSRPRDPRARPRIGFDVEGDGYKTVSRKLPEAAVAYEEADVRDWFEGHGLSVQDPIHYGTWRGLPGRSLQDIVVAEKRPSAG